MNLNPLGTTLGFSNVGFPFVLKLIPFFLLPSYIYVSMLTKLFMRVFGLKMFIRAKLSMCRIFEDWALNVFMVVLGAMLWT